MRFLSRRTTRSWSRRALGRLSSYRPQFRDWRFWVIVGLVVLIAIGHKLSEIGGWLPQVGLLYLLPVSLFLVPVAFAALSFGLGGAMATAGLSAVAVMPDIFQHAARNRRNTRQGKDIPGLEARRPGHGIGHDLGAMRNTRHAPTGWRVVCAHCLIALGQHSRDFGMF